MATLSEKTHHRVKVAEIASAILSRNIRPLLGVRMLVSHLHELGKEVAPEIVNFFKGVASESDDLPLGNERQHWNEEALRQKDVLAESYERHVAPRIMEAANKLLLQFSGFTDSVKH